MLHILSGSHLELMADSKIQCLSNHHAAFSLRKDSEQDETGARGYYEWMSQNSARKAGPAPYRVPLS